MTTTQLVPVRVTDQLPTQDPTTIQRILEERALALARPLKVEAPADAVGLVVLAIGSERYGVDVQHVREIQPLTGLTPVPGLPSFWAGLINLRGRLFPILDLRRYLGLSSPSTLTGTGTLTGTSSPDRRWAGDELVPVRVMVLVSAAGLEAGLLADDVPEVRWVPQAEIGPPLTEALGSRREIIAGMTADLLLVLDLERMLADPQLVVQLVPVRVEEVT